MKLLYFIISRLPVTPACLREAKRGETIMSMSGSPISNPTKLDCNLPGILTLGNGKVCIT